MTSRRITDAWVDLWLDARISVEGADGEVDLDDAAPPPLSWPVTVVTAYNPLGIPRSDERNREANRELELHLQERGLPTLRATGRARRGDWSEPGFAVAGLSLEEAAKLGRKAEQLAVFYVTSSEVRILAADGTPVASRRRAPQRDLVRPLSEVPCGGARLTRRRRAPPA